MDDLDKYCELARPNKDLINLNPIQTGGRLTDEAKAALMEFADGYSICDYCGGSLEDISKPCINEFVSKDLPAFLGADRATVVHGAREGLFLVLSTIMEKGDTFDSTFFSFIRRKLWWSAILSTIA